MQEIDSATAPTKINADNAAMWPTLAERLEKFSEAYLLSTDDSLGKITVLVVDGENWRIMEDDWADDNGFREIVIKKEGVAAIGKLTNQVVKSNETAGRPPVYTVEHEGNDIFMRHIYGGETIRGLARDLNMSPSTVQKLLNETKLRMAEKFFNGEMPLLKDSPYWQKNIALLRWAVKRMRGKKRQECEKFVNNALK